MKRAPLKAKRDKPRRNEGRVAHERIKPKGKAAPTAEERWHMDRVAALGCCVTGRKDVVIHHIMHMAGKARRRDHRFVVALIPELHNMGPLSVHALGGEAAFMEQHGVDLVERAIQDWEQRRGVA